MALFGSVPPSSPAIHPHRGSASPVQPAGGAAPGPEELVSRRRVRLHIEFYRSTDIHTSNVVFRAVLSPVACWCREMKEGVFLSSLLLSFPNLVHS